MFNVTRRVSFSIAIAMTVGWGIFFLLFLTASNTTLEAQQRELLQTGTLTKGVKLNIQADKSVYRAGETVLVAIRNDSRIPVWIRQFDEECQAGWWSVERLDSDGETWQAVEDTPPSCTAAGIVRFTNHTLKSAEWKTVIRDISAKNQERNVRTGTYRIAMPYLKGKAVARDTTWSDTDAGRVNSVAFTVL